MIIKVLDQNGLDSRFQVGDKLIPLCHHDDGYVYLFSGGSGSQCSHGNRWALSRGDYEIVEEGEEGGIDYSKKIYKLKREKHMTSIAKFVKNLALSADEKLLCKFGFKNDCGEYTQEAEQFAVLKACEAQEAAMIEVAKGLEAEEKESKK